MDPERGWIATANNRPAPEDFPYPLSGTWAHGLRAERIRQMIESKAKLSREDFIAMQHDALSVRAQALSAAFAQGAGKQFTAANR